MPYPVSCIIPFYNEGERVLATIAVVEKSNLFAEIIAVDDGSNDAVSGLIATRFPHVLVMRQEKNLGKAEAVREGVHAARETFVFLLDADLKELRAEDIEAAIHPVIASRFDMVMMSRGSAQAIVRLNRGHILFSGQRMMRRSDLLAVFSKPVSKYQLEIAINAYMKKRRRRVGWVPATLTNTYKMQKWGFFGGLRYDLSMLHDLVSYAGIKEYVSQVLFFAREKIKTNEV